MPVTNPCASALFPYPPSFFFVYAILLYLLSSFLLGRPAAQTTSILLIVMTANLVPHNSDVKAIRSHNPCGALLTRTLPSYSGQYSVGARDVEFPVETRLIGSFALADPVKGTRVGFELDTVLYTLFYPCKPADDRASQVMWFPKLAQTVSGFLRMAHITNWFYNSIARFFAGIAVRGTTFPAFKDAPLIRAPEGQPWPVIVFSHGVGCSRLMYSAFCGEMASRGYVVAAVEHRDGSSPWSVITYPDGTTKEMEFMHYTDVNWPELKDQPIDDTRLRHDQVNMRLAEIDGVIETLKLITGSVKIRDYHGGIMEDFRGKDWEGSLDTDRVILAGHSLGGTAVISAGADPRFKPRAVIATDPAMQRLEPWKGTIHCPVLSVNSEEFTDSDDFDRLLDAVPTFKGGSTVFSIPGSTHPSFSDVFLILPGLINRKTGLSCSPLKVLSNTIIACETFLEGTLQYVVDQCKVVGGRQPRPFLDDRGPMWVQGDVVDKRDDEDEDGKLMGDVSVELAHDGPQVF